MHQGYIAKLYTLGFLCYNSLVTPINKKEAAHLAAKTAKSKNNFLIYKGKPLVRCGNIMYYGDMADKYVIMMQILSTKMIGNLETADKVSVQLQYTDPEVRGKDKTIKKTEKDGLYNAIDVGSIWLERALEE